ncbi:MAG: hypothetical protein ACKOEO_13765 [Planctomycetaceae bacterium]
MRRSALPRIMSLLAVVLAVSSTGCQSGSLLRNPSQLIRDPGRIVGRPRIEKSVGRVVTLWEPSHGKDANGRNARGFAGQILFFGPGGQTGCRIHGKVVVSVFDQYDPESEEDPILLHRYEFDADAWEAHRGEGTLGHSYSVFIPYARSHRDQVNCALKVELIQEDGRTISSQETEVLLPGRNTVQAAASRTRGFVRESRIEPGKRVTPASATQPEDTLDTMSIPLPRKK